ncbi:MAG: DUF452 family protein [Muribaculum sp.]|nr:DUF452 family protein [Muribaculum sp.]
MKAHLTSTDTTSYSPRLILLFTGWSMDFRPFEQLRPKGYDLCVVWDYRDSRISLPDRESSFEEMLGNYIEIAVVAWSFGVPAASNFISEHQHLPITAKIAINGTQHPIDDELGIPEQIFDGTLEGLSEKTLGKFHLRMAGNGVAYKKFAERLPEREIDELREELRTISSVVYPIITWDKAIILDSDRIIPPANQSKAWSGEAFEVIHRPGAHLPDFKTLFAQTLNDKSLVKQRFSNASKTYDKSAVIQRKIADCLVSLWKPDSTYCYDTLEIGCGTGYSTRLINNAARHKSLRLWDLTISDGFYREFSSSHSVIKSCDAEIEIRSLAPSSLNVIFSASTVQWFNSLPEFLRQVHRVLRNGGKAFISTFGPETMHEINVTLGKQSPYPTLASLQRMAPYGLVVSEIFEDTFTITFTSPLEALRHIQQTGVNALSSHTSPSDVRSLLRNYPLDSKGNASITYQPIYIVLEKS